VWGSHTVTTIPIIIHFSSAAHLKFLQKHLFFLFISDKTSVSALYACVMILTVASATSLQDCEADMTGFELVTGYVFTAPDDLLDSIPGTLMLTDCLEACHANDTCESVNYETGLCVMFSSNADAYPGKIKEMVDIFWKILKIDTSQSIPYYIKHYFSTPYNLL